MKSPTRIPFVLSWTILSFALMLAGVPVLSAQQTSPSTLPPPPAEAPNAKPISPSTPPPPPPPETPRTDQISPSTPPPPPSEDTPAAPVDDSAESSKPVFDPYHAQKSLDVGTFYMKKGKYDAAIDRFQEAARYSPSLAMPWRLMGETYEKQHAYDSAIEAYKKYLDLFPRAPDAEKITKQISMLEEKVGKESSKDTTH